MIFVDSHVHIYDCFCIDFLLDSALRNFKKAALLHAPSSLSVSFVLLLTEGNKENWYRSTLKSLAISDKGSTVISKNWKAEKNNSSSSVKLIRDNSTDKMVHVVCGQQVVTREKIEVLGLYSQKEIVDNLSLDETVQCFHNAGAIVVLPWGAGKWFGRRGVVIRKFLIENKYSHVYLGDNGGRPRLWPKPTMFRLADEHKIAILPGSDPLPLKEDAARIGSFGFFLDDKELTENDPINNLKAVLLSENVKLFPFGRLQANVRFVYNQLRLRLI